ncbi:cache domain-containing sensor histidine kinase [Paenibacillus tarimensis]|uniref:cache domain-containing sensor histidine kinase n=1 Tax=Paenibacillus tarimensis TaxID=416012 RepID=UPI001F313ACF|nr:sensor histidine kinase [Paenibacillus tarimensis]MCF2943090.1 sensor histidine kinase [Paenibacillus tarimensis]
MKRLRWLQFKSIHTSIAIAFSVLIICTTLVLSYNTYRVSSEAVTDNSLQYTAQLVEQVSRNINTYIANMESISELAARQEPLRRLSMLEDSDGAETQRIREETEKLFQSIVSSRSDIAAIMFAGTNGVIVSSRGDAVPKPYRELSLQDWYTQAIEAGGQLVISSSRVQHLFEQEYRWVVSLSCTLPGREEGNPGGVLLVDLNFSVINDLCSRIHMGSRGYIFLLDPEGSLVYHPQQQLVYSGLKSEAVDAILSSADRTFKFEAGGVRKLYTVHSSGYGWKTVGVNDPDELVGSKGHMQRVAALWGILCLVVALGISVMLSRRLMKPVKALNSNMKLVEKGYFDTRTDFDSPNEFGRLARTFNLMTAKIKELMEQVVQEQEDKRLSELKALQAQIHPHFLYNTLDSIIWMAETGKMNEVVRMTSALSKLLRTSISKGEERVPIRRELDHIEHYLTIQCIRYRDKFTYEMEVDPDILDCLILKLVLQPLVENAIYHGIKNMADPGHIRIRGYAEGDDIMLLVEDNGTGTNADNLNQMLARQAEVSGPDIGGGQGVSKGGGGGVGLHNVSHRLRLNYGEGYGLRFESDWDEGTTVYVRIPLQRREE